MNEIDYSNLCYYDLRNPDGVNNIKDAYDEEEFKIYGNHSQLGCYCDNCFYRRTKLTEQLIEMEEFYTKNSSLKNNFEKEPSNLHRVHFSSLVSLNAFLDSSDGDMFKEELLKSGWNTCYIGVGKDLYEVQEKDFTPKLKTKDYYKNNIEGRKCIE